LSTKFDQLTFMSNTIMIM